MIDQDLLRDQEQATRRLESLDIKRAIFAIELHQVNAGQITCCVIEEHVFRTRITGVNPSRFGAGMPLVDGAVVLHSGVAAMPGTFSHPIQQIAGFVFVAHLVGIGNPASRPFRAFLHRLHEVIRYTDRQVGVLEQNRTVRLAVEVGFVFPTGNQSVRFLLFLPFALDEFQHVGMPDLERLHFRGATRFATRLHNSGDLIVDPHERKWARWTTTSREFFFLASKSR